MRRFGVDEVVPANERLPTRSLGSCYPTAVVVGGDPETQVIDHGETHPLLAAVGIAFAQHRPLVLSPDAIWLTIAQGLAQHVRLHADSLRARLVRHTERKALRIHTVDFPRDAERWAAAIELFRTELAAELGDGRARLFECNFSTSTDTDLLASQVVLLDAYSPYFSFHLSAICGIPEIALLGTVDDWRVIRARIDVLRELDLDRWCDSLAPICDQLVRTAAGDVDVAFWRRIYNPRDAYGGELITGWITRFYPYVEGHGKLDVPNPMLALALDEPRDLTTSSSRAYAGPGLRSSSVPATVSRVRVHLTSDRGDVDTVAVVAGLVAVHQDAEGALRPIAGWHVEPATTSIDDVIARIAREHHVEDAPNPRPMVLQGPADVVALFSRIETATLFAGDRPWTLCAPRDHWSVSVERSGQYLINRIATLGDGRSLCCATLARTGATVWLVCRLQLEPAPDMSPGVLPGHATAIEPPSQIRVIGGELASILEFALDSGGDIDPLDAGGFDMLLHA